jgi:hypothetical protein
MVGWNSLFPVPSLDAGRPRPALAGLYVCILGWKGWWWSAGVTEAEAGLGNGDEDTAPGAWPVTFITCRADVLMVPGLLLPEAKDSCLSLLLLVLAGPKPPRKLAPAVVPLILSLSGYCSIPSCCCSHRGGADAGSPRDCDCDRRETVALLLPVADEGLLPVLPPEGCCTPAPFPVCAGREAGILRGGLLCGLRADALEVGTQVGPLLLVTGPSLADPGR